MLVLSRKPNQTIVLSNGTLIKVIACDRGRCMIGIQADPAVRVLRGEIADRIAAAEGAKSIEPNKPANNS